MPPLPIFLAAPPGLEPFLAEEAAEIGLPAPRPVPGGVETEGDWPAIWRANLELRGASRVLVRIAAFRARSLSELDSGTRAVPWARHLAWGVPVRVDVSTRRTRLQSRAAGPRIERAIRDGFGARIDAAAPVTVKARIEGDTASLSLDTSGEPLHRRGHKEWVGKAPMRENLAALLLRAAGYRGDAPVLDPMCGSGSFVLEAAGIAAGLQPGRDRAFAFEHLAGFDAAAFSRLRRGGGRGTDHAFLGSDRDAGAIRGAAANAARAGLAEIARFERRALTDARPHGLLRKNYGKPTGFLQGFLVVNPPYGARLGNRPDLFALYGALGRLWREHFPAWRLALVTSESSLARATGIPLKEGPVFSHGGLKLRLWLAGPEGA